MKYILVLVFLFSFTISACTKEQNRQLLNAYFKFNVDGTGVEIKDEIGIDENTFECIIKGDTSLFINVDKRALGAGFYINAHPLKDTTYVLDSLRIGYYTDPITYRRYSSNNQNKGTLTIKRGTFQAKDMLNTLEGSFSFTGEDTATKKIHVITEGKFLMERKIE